jgi:hypothetical protein
MYIIGIVYAKKTMNTGPMRISTRHVCYEGYTIKERYVVTGR